jgi:hypothetical protein
MAHLRGESEETWPIFSYNKAKPSHISRAVEEGVR